MRRADRLFQIVQTLRGRRLTTAAQLAEWLEVSERTIYRDIADLSASGVPIDGEAGVGYRLHDGFDLPPLMFSFDEIEALVAGARMIESWGGPKLGRGAQSALEKIAAALPREKRIVMERTRLFAPDYFIDRKLGERLEFLREAIRTQHVIRLDYRDGKGADSVREVRPLACFFWGDGWSLTAWCELRGDFRNFRLDRVVAMALTPRRFAEEPGKRLEDFLRKVGDAE